MINDAKVVVKFLREHIFSRFGMASTIISDHGTHLLIGLLVLI